MPAEDPGVVLHNPDMGWVLYENYPVDQQPNGSSTLVTLPDQDFPGVDHVALMFSWADVEVREGEDDFSKVYHAYDYWRKRGKQIQLRLSTESLLWWSNQQPPHGIGVPEDVLARVPSERKQRREFGGLFYTTVDARDPFYRERLAAFLEAVAANFSGKREVNLIDLRGFGLWGEWHSGFRYSSVRDKRDALSGVLDIWSHAFPHHFLALSYSYDPDSPPEYFAGPRDKLDMAFTKTFDDYLRFSAFDYALTKPNITLRRDGCGGAVTSNERRLCEETFSKATKGPFVCEFLGGYHQAKNGGAQWISWMIDDALSLHPNYIALLGWQGADARDFLLERSDLVAHGLRNMGYRLVPIELTYPAVVRRGRKISIGMKWINRGVGRAIRDFRVQLGLVDHSAKCVATLDLGAIPTSHWIKGEVYPVRRDALVGTVSAGDYDLQMRLTDPRDSRGIMLPLTKIQPDGAYFLGKVTVVP